MKRILTKNFFMALTETALDVNGYEVELDADGYIRALSDDPEKPDLLIYTVGRCLSDRKTKETTIISADARAVKKLEKRSQELSGKWLPCVAFGVGKYSFDDAEVCVVPTSVWVHQAQRGGVFSVSSGKYYFDFMKAGNTVPFGAILRKIWKSTNL